MQVVEKNLYKNDLCNQVDPLSLEYLSSNVLNYKIIESNDNLSTS
jgi:hypothetical protein